jgi:hypothetical protein
VADPADRPHTPATPNTRVGNSRSDENRVRSETIQRPACSDAGIELPDQSTTGRDQTIAVIDGCEVIVTQVGTIPVAKISRLADLFVRSLHSEYGRY